MNNEKKRLFHDIESVLFDFDGTLFDTSVAITKAFNGALIELGHEPVSEDLIGAMIGRPLKEMFLEMASSASKTEDALHECVDAYRRLFFPLSAPSTTFMPTARETTMALYNGGIALAVVTTRTADGARHILKEKGLEEAFSAVIGLEHVKRPKPNAEPVIRALKALDVRAGRAIMVGDTPDDIVAGASAGAFTVAVTTGPFVAGDLRQADAVVDTLSELLPLVGL